MSVPRHAVISTLTMILLVGCSTAPATSAVTEPQVAKPRLAMPTDVPTLRPASTLSPAASCVSTSATSGSYSVKVCISSPASGAALSGDQAVTATVSLSGSAPRVQRVLFGLDGGYLLMDYRSAYTFTLPTARWPDGAHSISVSAVLRDGFTTRQAGVSVTFRNGLATASPNAGHFQPTDGRSTGANSPFIVSAGGDGASGEPNAAKVADLIVNQDPNLFLYLGDVYERGSIAEFYNWYGTSSTYFGRLRGITDPTVGNHEYLTSGAQGYFDYWNNIPAYYSFDAHGWHFISLDSNGQYVPTGAGSAQYQWLQKDLAAVPAQTCTIVYYHHPLFNIGSEGATTGMSAIWQLMAKYHVDIVLNGHDHDYQRWAPLDGDGHPNSSGIVEFVVGSSGHGLQDFTHSDNRVAYSNNSNPGTFGALFLQLNSQSANFSYKNTSGTVLDSGVIPCKP